MASSLPKLNTATSATENEFCARCDLGGLLITLAEIPKVLTEIILDYTHHPLFELWKWFEIHFPSFARGPAVPPSKILSAETHLQTHLNEPDFHFTDELKILWSICDGVVISSIKLGHGPWLWPSLEAVLQITTEFEAECDSDDVDDGVDDLNELTEEKAPLTDPQPSDRVSLICFDVCSANRDHNFSELRYHLESGVFFLMGGSDELNDFSSLFHPDVLLDNFVETSMNENPPLVVFHSLEHLLRCLVTYSKQHPAAFHLQHDYLLNHFEPDYLLADQFLLYSADASRAKARQVAACAAGKLIHEGGLGRSLHSYLPPTSIAGHLSDAQITNLLPSLKSIQRDCFYSEYEHFKSSRY